MRGIVAMLALVACATARPPTVIENVAPVPTPWCLRLYYEATDDSIHQATVCLEHEEACWTARSHLTRIGGLLRLVDIDDCAAVPSGP